MGNNLQTILFLSHLYGKCFYRLFLKTFHLRDLDLDEHMPCEQYHIYPPTYAHLVAGNKDVFQFDLSCVIATQLSISIKVHIIRILDRMHHNIIKHMLS